MVFNHKYAPHCQTCSLFVQGRGSFIFYLSVGRFLQLHGCNEFYEMIFHAIPICPLPILGDFFQSSYAFALINKELLLIKT